MAKAKVNKKMGPVAVELPECPVCMETMSAPIFQCQSGHSLCNCCTRNLCPPICPICRQAMTQMRNWQLEDLISKASVPCPNKSSGCVYNVASVDLEDHLKECIFRDMTCPLGAVFGRCFWTGKLKDMLGHFKELHPQNSSINTDTDININNISTSVDDRHMYLIPQGKLLFILTIKIDTSQKLAYWVVQLIGSKKAAQYHIYEIQITSKQDNNRKVIFTDHCFNDALDASEIFRQAKCGLMPLSMLSHFIKNGVLSFRFSIKKNQPNLKNKEKAASNNNQNNQGPKHVGPKNSGQNNKAHRGKSPGPLHNGPKGTFNKPHNKRS